MSGKKDDQGKPPGRCLYLTPLAQLSTYSDRDLIEFCLQFEHVVDLLQQSKVADAKYMCVDIHHNFLSYLKKTNTVDEIIQNISGIGLLGARKYGLYNYKNGLTTSRIVDAIGRHTGQYLYGQVLDKESGLSHLFHILANIYILVTNINNNDLGATV